MLKIISSSEQKIEYIHGRTDSESKRLDLQASMLESAVFRELEPGLSKISSIVELGCGSGANAERFLLHENITKIVGIDIGMNENRSYVEEKFSHYTNEDRNKIEWVQADIQEDSTLKKYVGTDCFFITYVLEHLSDVPGVLNNIYDSMKVGSIFMVTECSWDSVCVTISENAPKNAAAVADNFNDLVNQFKANQSKYGDPCSGKNLGACFLESKFGEVKVNKINLPSGPGTAKFLLDVLRSDTSLIQKFGQESISSIQKECELGEEEGYLTFHHSVYQALVEKH